MSWYHGMVSSFMCKFFVLRLMSYSCSLQVTFDHTAHSLWLKNGIMYALMSEITTCTTQNDLHGRLVVCGVLVLLTFSLLATAASGDQGSHQLPIGHVSDVNVGDSSSADQKSCAQIYCAHEIQFALSEAYLWFAFCLTSIILYLGAEADKLDKCCNFIKRKSFLALFPTGHHRTEVWRLLQVV